MYHVCEVCTLCTALIYEASYTCIIYLYIYDTVVNVATTCSN